MSSYMTLLNTAIAYIQYVHACNYILSLHIPPFTKHIMLTEALIISSANMYDVFECLGFHNYAYIISGTESY